jgi:predicted PurR-regulated permease PerM
MSDFEPSQPRSALSPDWQPGTRLVVGVLMILLAAVTLYQLRQLMIPVVLALLLAYVLHPLVLRLERGTGMKRWMAVGLIFLVILLLMIGATTGIGIAASQRVAGFGEFLGTVSSGLPDFIEGLMDLSFTIGPWTVDLANANLEPFTEAITSALTPLLQQTGSILSGVAGATASAVGTMLLVLVIGFYLLLYFERFGASLLHLVPEAHKADAQSIMHDVGAIWQAFLRGQLMLGLAVGAATAIIMAILGVRFALGLGVIAGVLEFVPIFGPWITGIISVLVALFQGFNRWGLTPVGFALLVLGASILIQQIENNILYPRIIGHSLDLNPLVVLLALLAAGSIAGVVGLLLAAPAVATLRLCFGYVYWKTVGVQPPPRRVLVQRRPSIIRVLLERFRRLRKQQQAADTE